MKRKEDKKTKLLVIGILFWAVFTALFVVCGKGIFKEVATDEAQNIEMKLKINEIQNLMKEEKQEEALQECVALRQLVDTVEKPDIHGNLNKLFIMAVIAFGIFISGLMIYVYCSILAPFGKLKAFAENIARGELDIPLEVDRGQYFGQFTWAFDHMRSEMKKSKAAEQEAIENNKTVIAALSHDIKTPVAGMRAVAEALEAGMDTSVEKRQKYIGMLIQRCDEVTRLTNDLFTHSISEMDRLKINREEVDLSGILKEQAEEWNTSNRAEIRLEENENITVFCDKVRMKQVVENLLNNAEKYAQGSPIDIALTQENDKILLKVRDYGPGILDEDMPFIKNKFYRGKNVGEASGSGLGLFIVDYLVQKMGGSFELENANPGLCAKIYLKK